MKNEKNRKKLLTNFGWFGIVIERLKQRKICPSGGIGRRTGLKILRGNTRTGSIPVSGSLFKSCLLYAQIAQLVEQRTENPRVTGSIPVLGICYALIFIICSFYISKREFTDFFM